METNNVNLEGDNAIAIKFGIARKLLVSSNFLLRNFKKINLNYSSQAAQTSNDHILVAWNFKG